MKHRVSIVIPVFNEGDNVKPVLRRIFESVKIDAEVLVVYDDLSDSTVSAIKESQTEFPALRGVHNTYGRGPANAIRFGINASSSDVVVVTMADGSDDASQIEALTRLVERGVVVAAASRYARSGQQVGGPFLKSLISRIAGLTLYYGARVGTRDATNSFKAYSTEFIRQVGIESDKGFEIGIELVAKARRHRRPVAEVPTIWLDRSFGVSNFKTFTWLPRYLKWYFYAFGPKK
ncbi:MAG: glycosyltransferase family 2 protein [Acidimicrobiaceae bacterium]